MKNRKATKTLGVLLVTAGLTLSPVRAYSETRCEKMTDDQLHQALDQELAALESDSSDEPDDSLEKDILAALGSGKLIDYADLEKTMQDDGTNCRDVIQEAVEEADEADSPQDPPKDAPKDPGKGTNTWSRVSRRGHVSRADGATDAVRELIQKTDEARAQQK